MNQIYCTPTLTMPNPIVAKTTNKRRAYCTHCKRSLAPGDGIGYPSRFGRGAGNDYYCQACADVKAVLDADEKEIEAAMASIAEYLAANLDARGGIDTTSYYGGMISLRNAATMAYGHIANMISACGLYALAVAQAVDLALTEQAPAAVYDITKLADGVCAQTLAEAYKRTGRLPWVDTSLARAAMQKE